MYTDTKLKEYNEREERFRLAIEEATTNKAASINSIANKYKVSRTTLSRRIHGFKNTRNSHEKQQKFTNDEELTLVSDIQSMLRDHHHIPQKREILQLCENLLKEKHKNQQDIDPSFFKVGKNWIDRFLERHNSELMINEQVTLAEYYKNEFIERKKLRTERGYKTTSVGSLTPDEESLHATPHSSNSPLSHRSSIPQNHEQSHLHHPQRHNQEPSAASAFTYQDHMNPYGSTMPQVQPQVQVQVQVQPQPLVSQYSEWQPPHQHIKQSQFPISHNQPMPYGTVPTANKFSYSYPQANNSPMVMYGQPTSTHQEDVQPSSFSLSSGLHSFGFPQHANGTAETSANSNNNTTTNGTSAPSVPSLEVDMMQFFQNGRFQYELARQRIMKELEMGNSDVLVITKMLNFVFSQIDRDLGVVSSHNGSGYSMGGY